MMNYDELLNEEDIGDGDLEDDEEKEDTDDTEE